jgi:hypothetical protein
MRTLLGVFVALMVALSFSIIGFGQSATAVAGTYGLAGNLKYVGSKLNVDVTGNQIQQDYPYNGYGGATGYRGSVQMTNRTGYVRQITSTNYAASGYPYVYPYLNAGVHLGMTG